MGPPPPPRRQSCDLSHGGTPLNWTDLLCSLRVHHPDGAPVLFFSFLIFFCFEAGMELIASGLLGSLPLQGTAMPQGGEKGRKAFSMSLEQELASE